MPNIMIVCTANICRSPVAEAILKDRLKKQGYDDWTVVSAGTWAYPGQRAADMSIRLMAEQGLDILNHTSQVVSDPLLSSMDLVLCMEIGHAEALRVEFPAQREKIHLLSEMSGKHYSVPDPFGGPEAGYERMVEEVAKLIDDGMPRIVELASAASS